MMSKNELTSDERETTRQSTEPAVVMTTASGEAESTEEPTVHVDDLDVFVSMMLLEDAPAVLSVGLLCEEMSYFCAWKKEEYPSLVKDGKIIRCKSETPCAHCGSVERTSYT